MAKPPAERSSATDIAQFIQRSTDISTFADRQARLIFAIDATASRQATWDSACHMQSEMFSATNHISALAIQLCYYRGINDFSASPWLGASAELANTMSRVSCEGGHTQIARLLRHALAEHQKSSVKAVVFIGDAVEESPDKLSQLAGQCGLKGLPLFLFQEGQSNAVKATFRNMAKLSKGAYAHFDQNSADTLAGLLGAVASFAAGGHTALENINSDGAKLLLRQLKP